MFVRYISLCFSQLLFWWRFFLVIMTVYACSSALVLLWVIALYWNLSTIREIDRSPCWNEPPAGWGFVLCVGETVGSFAQLGYVVVLAATLSINVVLVGLQWMEMRNSPMLNLAVLLIMTGVVATVGFLKPKSTRMIISAAELWYDEPLRVLFVGLSTGGWYISAGLTVLLLVWALCFQYIPFLYGGTLAVASIEFSVAIFMLAIGALCSTTSRTAQVLSFLSLWIFIPLGFLRRRVKTSYCLVLIPLFAKLFCSPFHWFEALILSLPGLLSLRFETNVGSITRLKIVKDRRRVQIFLVLIFSALCLLLVLCLSQHRSTSGIVTNKDKVVLQSPFLQQNLNDSMCKASWADLTLSDFACFSYKAYNPNVKCISSEWRDETPQTEKDSTVRYMHYQRGSVHVVSIRGSRGLEGRDWLQNALKWQNIALLQVASQLFPLSVFWPIEQTTSWLIGWENDDEWVSRVTNYTLNLSAKFPDATIFLTGHSLGGGIAKLAAATLAPRLNVTAIAFASPGTYYARQKHQNLHTLADYSVTLQPDKDIVSQIDYQTGTIYRIPCSGSRVECHMMDFIFCALRIVCGVKGANDICDAPQKVRVGRYKPLTVLGLIYEDIPLADYCTGEYLFNPHPHLVGIWVDPRDAPQQRIEYCLKFPKQGLISWKEISRYMNGCVDCRWEWPAPTFIRSKGPDISWLSKEEVEGLPDGF